MIIDDKTFTDLTVHLRRASDGLLEAARQLADHNEVSSSRSPRAMSRALESLSTTNREVVALQNLLRAVWETNREHRSGYLS